MEFGSKPNLPYQPRPSSCSMHLASRTCLWLLPFFWFLHTAAMMGKRRLNYDPAMLAEEPGKKLRANVEDLFARNTLPGTRTQTLVNDMADCGIPEFQGMKKRHTKDAARNLRRTFLSNCLWPKGYWAEVRVKNKRTGKSEKQWCEFLLPHELFAMLHRFGNDTALCSTDGMDVKTLEHYRYCQEQSQCQTLLGVGIWGDGVPCNWDRSETVETISINLPGQTGDWKQLRIPIVGLSSKQVIDDTWVDLFEVIAWSFQCAASGYYPASRHDGKAWLARSDAERRKTAGKSLDIKAALVECRADWQFHSKVFALPGWRTLRGCCWRCNCTPDQAQLS